ncbi:MAG: ABC transporter permease, partial [Planctomycetales bacterium]|nr:ABC transporter permease [Planctomycetales bacterium]
MATLDRKLYSDLRSIAGQAIAIALVLSCGIATFVMSSSMVQTLESTGDRYYADQRFAHLFAHLTRAPKTLESRLAAIPGVAAVQTRVVRSGQVSMPGLDEPANLRLLSLADDPGRELNQIYLVQGRRPDPKREGEVVVAESFALAHQLRPGDRLNALLDGKYQQLSIVGIGLSPEFLFAIEPGQFLPDDRRFGIVWMSERHLAAAFDMEGAFDDVSVLLQKNASPERVKQAVDRLIDPYGGTGVFDRNEQDSHKRLADELLQLRNMATVSPTIFLIVATFLFNVALSRLVRAQRDEIATLRAFGFTSLEIGWHYLKFMLILVMPGLVSGVGLGYVLSLWISEVYQKFFRFPFLETQLSTSGASFACLVALFACLIGGGGALRSAMRLAPAEAMRPPAPPNYHAGWLEAFVRFFRLPPVARMVVRKLSRSVSLSAMTIVGIALAEAVIVLGAFVEDTVDYVMDTTFRRSQQQDVTVVFTQASSEDVINDLRHLPGVAEIEPFRAVPVRIRHEWRVRRLAIQGLDLPSELFRVFDDQDQLVPIAPEGLTVSEKLAELLGAKIGDTVQIEVLEGERVRREVVIAATFRDYTEPGAYMPRESLQRLLQEGPRVSGAFVRITPGELPRFQQRVKQTPTIATAINREAMLDSFRDTFAENMLIMRTVNLAFATVIALGVIYNCARITLAERSRELATMRVIGFSRTEVAWVLWGELGTLTLLAVPLGLVVGYGLCVFASQSLDTETHRFPVIVQPSTFAYAALVVLLTALGSLWLVR